MTHTISAEQRGRIQVVRGICIFSVILIHSISGGMLQVFAKPFINFAVAGFLFLSGMLSDPGKWKPVKRLKKVLIPYLIWVLVYTVLTQYRTIPRIPIQYLKNLLTARSSAILYYVPVYCELTLLIPLFDRAAKSKYRLLVFLISPVEVLLVRTFPLLGIYTLPRWIILARGISCLGFISFFYLGFLIGNGYIADSFLSKHVALAVLLSIPLQMAEAFWLYQYDTSTCGTAMKLSAMLTSSFCCLLLYCYIRSDRGRIIPPLKLLGDYSFGIYFSHLAIKKTLSYFLPFFAALPFPINGLVLLSLSLLFVITGRKMLGKFARYLSF